MEGKSRGGGGIRENTGAARAVISDRFGSSRTVPQAVIDRSEERPGLQELRLAIPDGSPAHWRTLLAPSTSAMDRDRCAEYARDIARSLASNCRGAVSWCECCRQVRAPHPRHLVGHLSRNIFQRVRGSIGDLSSRVWIGFRVRTTLQEGIEIRCLPLVGCIGFLEQESRLVAACRPDAQQVDPNAVLLRLLDTYSEVFVTG